MIPSKFIRFSARLVDYSLFYGLGVIISLLSAFDAYELFYVIFALFIPIFFVPIEALLLSTWGTTVGKYFFKMRVEEDGKKLSFGQAFKRALFLGNRPGTLVQLEMNSKKKAFSVLALIVLMCASAVGTMFKDFTFNFETVERNHAWVHHYAEEAGFEVDFPHEPELDSKKVQHSRGSIQYKEYSAEKNNVFYSVSYMDFPSKWKWFGTKTLLKKAVDLIVDNTKDAKLQNKKLSSHKGHNAIDFSYMQGEMEVKGKLVLQGNRLFKLTVAYPATLTPQLSEDQFLQSFDLASNSKN